jgi:hypothetical protein
MLKSRRLEYVDSPSLVSRQFGEEPFSRNGLSLARAARAAPDERPGQCINHGNSMLDLNQFLSLIPTRPGVLLPLDPQS